MLFPEDGSLPRITRSGLSPFNNVMIIKVPEQFRKPGETIFQLATLDPSKKTERWPADKFIYKNSVAEEVMAPNCSESVSTKEKEFEKPKFDIELQKSLFALEKQKLKEKISSAINSEHDKIISPNLKSYENHQDFKNQAARNHQASRKNFTTKNCPDNRGFRNREHNDGKSHHEARYNNKNRAMHIDPWIKPPLEYINPGYDESLKIPVNDLENHTVDLQRQQHEANRFYDERDFFGGHMSGPHLNDRIPIKNRSDISHPDSMVYPDQASRNVNWQRQPNPKRGLLSTPPMEPFDNHLPRNPPEIGYFEPNRNIPENPDFGPIPTRDRHNEETLDFHPYNPSYKSLTGFQYGNQYPNISGAEFVNDRNYIRNNRDKPNFHRDRNKDPNSEAMPFSNEIDSYRNDGGFHRPYPVPANGLEYQGRRYEQASGNDADFRKPEGNGFRPRNQHNRRDHRGRFPYRNSRGRRYPRGQRNDRFQKKNPEK